MSRRGLVQKSMTIGNIKIQITTVVCKRNTGSCVDGEHEKDAAHVIGPFAAALAVPLLLPPRVTSSALGIHFLLRTAPSVSNGSRVRRVSCASQETPAFLHYPPRRRHHGQINPARAVQYAFSLSVTPSRNPLIFAQISNRTRATMFSSSVTRTLPQLLVPMAPANPIPWMPSPSFSV